MVDRAKTLRRQRTSPEELLWTALRNRQVGGLKFRRQHPAGPYIVDFYCHSVSLAIEVDGTSHEERTRQDTEKTAYLEQMGVRVLRVTNDDVMGNLDAVTREIARLAGVARD
jgi:very-short-patch-repair endonuclease